MSLLAALLAVALSAGGWFTVDDFTRDMMAVGDDGGRLPLGSETGGPWDGGNSLYNAGATGTPTWAMTEAGSLFTFTAVPDAANAKRWWVSTDYDDGLFGGSNVWSVLEPYEVEWRIRVTDSADSIGAAHDIYMFWYARDEDGDFGPDLANSYLKFRGDTEYPAGGLLAGSTGYEAAIPSGWFRWRSGFFPAYNSLGAYLGTTVKAKVWAEGTGEPDWMLQAWYPLTAGSGAPNYGWGWAWGVELSPASLAMAVEIDWIKGRRLAVSGHTVDDEFTGDGTTTTFYLQDFQQIQSVAVDGVEVPGIVAVTPTITFDRAPSDGAVIEVEYIAA